VDLTGHRRADTLADTRIAAATGVTLPAESNRRIMSTQRLNGPLRGDADGQLDRVVAQARLGENE
jgi:hypothetical protein